MYFMKLAILIYFFMLMTPSSFSLPTKFSDTMEIDNISYSCIGPVEILYPKNIVVSQESGPDFDVFNFFEENTKKEINVYYGSNPNISKNLINEKNEIQINEFTGYYIKKDNNVDILIPIYNNEFRRYIVFHYEEQDWQDAALSLLPYLMFSSTDCRRMIIKNILEENLNK